MLYTRKGDNGTTKLFNSRPGERISKDSCQTECLGALDELNSFLGLCKVKSVEKGSTFLQIQGRTLENIVFTVQRNLFIIQAELAGTPKAISADKVVELEAIIDTAEKELPPIKTFFISGGTELASLFDIARTLARKAERRVIGAINNEGAVVSPQTLAFLNRLSSLFYAFARLSNHKSGITEQAPDYK